MLCVKVAEVALSRLHQLRSLHWRVEEAELFWARSELETAKHMMKTLIDDMQTVCLMVRSMYEVFNGLQEILDCVFCSCHGHSALMLMVILTVKTLFQQSLIIFRPLYQIFTISGRK